MIQKEKVLITEDDDTFRTVLQNYILKMGFEVEAASNGKEALQKINSEKDGFNLLLTDLDMPIMGGQNLIQEVKDMYPDMIIIVISSHNENDVIIDVMRHGLYR